VYENIFGFPKFISLANKLTQLRFASFSTIVDNCNFKFHASMT